MPLLYTLIGMLRPKRLIAIGRDAQAALDGLDVEVIGVRHPSYGGQREFLTGVCCIHGVEIDERDSQISSNDCDQAAWARPAAA